LGGVVSLFRETEASLLAFEEILRAPTEFKPAGPRRAEPLHRLCFDRVSFAYPKASESALSDISLEVQRGETIAFVGLSGSGKSTLIKLLVGLYRPGAGELFYNEVASADLDVDHLRARIGLVTQETQLFAGTIRDNLQFGSPQATDAQCAEALRQAAAERLLARDGNGLDTVIGEGGVKLSGGERQRLSIARALLRHPELLIFDEATSSVDPITELALSHTIHAVGRKSGAITIIVAHRLSTVMQADRIYVLEHGRIVETGRHAELLDQGGLYAALWRTQLGETPGAMEARQGL
jgi:ATP-binding cassette subfamily B protein